MINVVFAGLYAQRMKPLRLKRVDFPRSKRISKNGKTGMIIEKDERDETGFKWYDRTMGRKRTASGPNE